MDGVGIDLLEIERLERALERRPRLAERLFTTAEREYAASRARPARHLGGALLRQGGGREGARACDEWSWHDIEVVRRRRAAGGAPGRHGRRARGRARRRRRGLADPHARDGRRGRGAQPMSLPRWLDPLLDAEQMRATDEWAIETRGVPSLDLMERAGEGLADVGHAARARRPRRRRLRQGQQRRRRARRRAAAAPGRARGRRPARVAGRVARRATRRRCSSGCPGRRRSRSTRTRLKGAHVIVDALLGTGFEGAPRKPADEVIAAINAAKARVIAADVPSGVNASTGEVEGEAVARGRDGHVPPRQARAVDRARQGSTRATSHVIDIGIPRGGPAKAEAGADQRRRAARDAAARRRLDEVLLRQRVHPRRRERADRRAVDGRAGRDARRRRLRDRRRAGKPRALVHGEAARGDDGRPARDRTARSASRRSGRR